MEVFNLKANKSVVSLIEKELKNARLIEVKEHYSGNSKVILQTVDGKYYELIVSEMNLLDKYTPSR